MKIQNKYLDELLYRVWEWGERASNALVLAMILVLGISLLVCPVIVPVAMLIAGKSFTVCSLTGLALGIIWFLLFCMFAALGFKEHDPVYGDELELLYNNKIFERPRLLKTESKAHKAVMLFKRKANDLAFLLFKEDRGFRRDKVHLVVMDSDHNIVFETSYPAHSKTRDDFLSLFNQIINEYGK